MEKIKYILSNRRFILVAAGTLVLIFIFAFTVILSLRSNPPRQNVENEIQEEALTPEELKEAEVQEAADYEAAKTLREFYAEHPWYDSFPIEEGDLFIAFSPSDEEFFVGIYPNEATGSNREEGIKLLRTKALDLIREAGANPDKYRVVYEVYD